MKRILEVCDSQSLREMIAFLCRKMGFEVAEASSGDEAFPIYREQGPFDLVLTDLFYFDHHTEPLVSKSDCIRDGIQLIRLIRAMKPDQRIVMHTGSDLESNGELADIPILRTGEPDFLPNLRSVLNRL